MITTKEIYLMISGPSQAEVSWKDATHETTDRKPSKVSHEVYANHFNMKIRRRPLLRIVDWAYLDRPLVWKKRQQSRR